MLMTAAICCYTDKRWVELTAAIDSIVNAEQPAAELLIVVDFNSALKDRLADHLSQLPAPLPIRVVSNEHTQGLSGARNTALDLASHEIVAFLDDDAEAPADWAQRIVAAFRDDVIAVGGGADPIWADGAAPRWFPAEFGWVIGCSYRGMIEMPGVVRNPIGCNMALRTERALQVGGFATALGRNGTDTAGCEETELCMRMTTSTDAQASDVEPIVWFEPDLRVRHHVTRERQKITYFWRRCIGEGRSKAAVADMVGSAAATSAERRYATVTLPLGVLRNLVQVFRGDIYGAARAVMIVIGLAATSLGFAQRKLFHK